MGLSEQIQKDMVEAMRSRDELRLSTLRMVKSALTNKEKDKRGPLDDKEAQQVLATLVKQRRDSIEQFQKGGRQELRAAVELRKRPLEVQFQPHVLLFEIVMVEHGHVR